MLLYAGSSLVFLLVSVPNHIMSEGTLFVKDSRTSREYEIPISRNAVPAGAFKQIKGPVTDTTRIDRGSVGLKLYDPGLANTATIESRLTYM